MKAGGMTRACYPKRSGSNGSHCPMRRKRFARIGTLLAATFLLTTSVAGAQARAHETTPSRRDSPNLLFILTDQQRRDTMKAYGNGRIKTPNLDKLASQSCVFERSYVTQPVCSPSRAS